MRPLGELELERQNEELAVAGRDQRAITAAEKRAPAAMERLENDFIGLDEMKKELKTAIAMASYRKAREQAGKPLGATTMHMVLEGSPGTGKTETAEIYGTALFENGVLPGKDGQPVFVKTSPHEIKGPYRGWTEQAMSKQFEAARGGVLFIDEANAWMNPNDEYGVAAMELLMKLAEDNRDRVAVVLAGYPGLKDRLGEINPGLPSRFPTTVHFQDLEAKDKVKVGHVMLKRDEFKMTPSARKLYSQAIMQIPGQGRDIRNFNELMVRNLAQRRAKARKPEQFHLFKVTPADVRAAIEQYRDEDGNLLSIV